MLDKKVFLLDKKAYTDKFVKSLTEEQLEAMAASNNYTDDQSFIKIDANGYYCYQSAIVCELKTDKDFFDVNDYHLFTFGFENDND